MTAQPSPDAHDLAAAQERSWEHLPDTFGSVEDISDSLITREQTRFLLTDRDGKVPARNNRGLGFYVRDARHLSIYDFLVDGHYPLVLLSTADSGFTQHQVLGNHRLEQDGHVIGRGTIEFNRERVLNHELAERLRITNYNAFPATVEVAYLFAADFADIFEVRGHTRIAPGTRMPPEVTERSLAYRYLGADGVFRRTLIEFDTTPTSLTAGRIAFKIELPARGTVEIGTRILTDEPAVGTPGAGLLQLQADYAEWRGSFASVETDNAVFNQVLNRSISDLRMLWTHDRQGHGYFAAGTPWFSTLFGRDSIITALQTLPFRHQLARECLALLVRHQGQNRNEFSGEEPGKILHEMREDELSAVGELPYRHYYGSVDSTPLFLLLAAEYFHWTGDRAVFESLVPAILNGLRWVREHGDLDGDGLIEYRTDSLDGLRNQGWKDSVESVLHADGSLCEGPIALAEVQGYVYLAYMRLAAAFAVTGDPDRARQLRRDALELRRRFNRAFWIPEQNRIALALDGQKRPADVMSSNAGQVLWSGIVSRERAAYVRDSLFEDDMFSGWGIRTLSSDSAGYYPIGYHVGTVWPHDNGIVANGLKRYGFDSEVNDIATALFEAACNFPNYRLPELFGGQARAAFQPPVPYPVACRPQAWTAGTMFHLLQAMLGLHADAANNRLFVIRPRLPSWLNRLQISDLRIGKGHVDLQFVREHVATYVSVHDRGDVEVITSGSTRAFDGRLPDLS